MVRDCVAVYTGRDSAVQRRYLAQYPGQQYFKIGGMTPAQVLQGFRRSYVYVDFGSASGRDRVPREAALQGCCVFLHAEGANALHADHAIPPYYRFTSRDVATGVLQEKILAVQADPKGHYVSQYDYHRQIIHEPVVFEEQVRRLFFED